MWRVLAATFIFLPFYSVGGNIYLCDKTDGSKVYSDIPCSNNPKIIEVKVPATPSEKRDQREQDEKNWLLAQIEQELPLCGTFSLDAIKFAHRASVGMTKNEVEFILGFTNDQRTSAYGKEVWTYKHYNNYEFVYFTNGCVTYWSK